MKQYNISEVGGVPLFESFNYLDANGKTRINSIIFNNKKIYIEATQGLKKTYVEADYDTANFGVLGKEGYVFDVSTNPVIFDLRFDIKKYTITVVEEPVEMTIGDIERKLGHKVSIVKEKTKDGDK